MPDKWSSGRARLIGNLLDRTPDAVSRFNSSAAVQDQPFDDAHRRRAPRAGLNRKNRKCAQRPGLRQWATPTIDGQRIDDDQRPRPPEDAFPISFFREWAFQRFVIGIA